MFDCSFAIDKELPYGPRDKWWYQLSTVRQYTPQRAVGMAHSEHAVLFPWMEVEFDDEIILQTVILVHCHMEEKCKIFNISQLALTTILFYCKASATQK